MSSLARTLSVLALPIASMLALAGCATDADDADDADTSAEDEIRVRAWLVGRRWMRPTGGARSWNDAGARP